MGSIDLLPEIPQEEVKEIEKKGKLNVFGVFSVLFVVIASLAILSFNLFSRLDYNRKSQQLVDSEGEVRALQYTELKQRTLMAKVRTYSSVREHDFSSDVVLSYLRDVVSDLSSVSSMYLDDAMTFSVRGRTDSYMNVARIWHNMAQQEDYFEHVNLDYVRMDKTDDGTVVSFAFSGVMIKEHVDNL